MTFVLVAGLIIAVLGGGGFAIMRLGAAASGDDRRDEARLRAQDKLAAGSREVRDGEVSTVVGTVIATDKPLIAPLSGRPCVAYKALLHVDVPGAPGRGVEDARAQPFVLAVGDDKFAVELRGVELAMPLEPVIPNDRHRNRTFASKHLDGVRIVKITSAYEAIVPLGATVSVSATVVRERAAIAEAEVGYRDEAIATRLIEPITIGPA